MTTSTTTVLENPMRRVKLTKVVLNIGVGRSGEAVERAKAVLKEISTQDPTTTKAKKTIREFGIHKGEPVGVVTTLRGSSAIEVLRHLLQAKTSKLPSSSFDEQGNCSFGIKEHIDIPGASYKPEIGIFGMDVAVVLERPGYRVARRRRGRSSVGRRHRVTKDEAIEFFKRELGVEVYSVEG
ncbi:MAG: 50S ribosomal protein L5 [Thaumarchaeota archaeon]|nr:50S ribosomal protein L5 [Nitrososphaerota archaeon]